MAGACGTDVALDIAVAFRPPLIQRQRALLTTGVAVIGSPLMAPLIYSLDLAGAFVFARSGGLAAARIRLDPFGFVVVAIVTGLGGGTLRNPLLDLQPVAWIADLYYLLVSLMAAAVNFVWAHLL